MNKQFVPQESLALLKILAMSTKEIEQGRYQPVAVTFADIRKRISQEEKLTKK